MNQELKDRLIKFVNSNTLTHQSKYGTICIKDLSRIEVFEQNYPHFICYRATKNERFYIDSKTEQLWRTLIQDGCGCCGKRISKAIIDSTIDDEVFCRITAPMIGLYSSSIEFFK